MQKTDSLAFHKKYRGKIEIKNKFALRSRNTLSLAYTPGVAEVCEKIKLNPESVYDYTMKNNFIAVVSDGTRVLGLGNIGAEPALPVMEGKAMLFKKFGGVDAIPICLKTTEKNKIIEIVQALEPTFGGINLEDIETPKVFEIYDELKKTMNIPVFHDDRHGTGVVVLGALINALKLVEKDKNAEIVLAGAGSAIKGIAEIVLAYGIKNITVLDSKGVLNEKREDIEEYKKWFVKNSNPKCSGTLENALKGADVVIAASAPNIIKKEMIASMNKNAIVFALSNPVSEISYSDAKSAGAKIVATGKSTSPNQVNNVLAFPGIFRGALNIMAKEINMEMMVAAAQAIANTAKASENAIIPSIFHTALRKNIAYAVMQKALETGVARRKINV